MQRTAIYIAHRYIELNLSVRCTLKTRETYHCYKYCGALHLLEGIKLGEKSIKVPDFFVQMHLNILSCIWLTPSISPYLCFA